MERSSEPAIEALAHQLEDITKLTRQKLNDLAEAEKEQKIVMIRLELEKMMNVEELPDERQLITVEEQLQQLPMQDEQTKALSEQLQQVRADKEKREAVKKSLEESLKKDVSQHIDELDEMLRPLIESAAAIKKKKSKKETAQDMEEQISLLNRLSNEIEHDVLPQLDHIREQSEQERLQLPSLPVQVERAQRLLDECKVSC